MGAFTHASTARPSRFCRGDFGVWYCGDRWKVALAETAYHFERFMRSTHEPAGQADLRELTCSVAGQLHDIRDNPAFAAQHDPNSWTAGQETGHAVHAVNGDGVVYHSVRWPGGLAAALFWPDLVKQIGRASCRERV